MKIFQESVNATDGTSLNYYRWIPSNPKAAVIISHGWNEHAGRYDTLARWFASQGYEVHALDHRGQGQSSGKRGHVSCWHDYAHDLEQLRISIDSETQYVLGHSMGGMIGIVHMLEYPGAFSAAALSGPAADLSYPVPWVKSALGKVMSGLWPTLSLKNDIDPYCVCSDLSVVQEYIADPLNHGRVTARWFSEYLKVIAHVKDNAASITTPIAIWHGSEDSLVAPWVSQQFFDLLTHPERKHEVVDGGYHEILYEANWQETAKGIKNWLERF